MALLLLCFGCKQTKTQQTVPQASASASSAGKAVTVGAPPAAPVPVDLLRRAAIRVITSSYQDESSQPEFMLDGLTTTAWQPNPPDPAPWIEVVFSEPVELQSVSLNLRGGLPPAPSSRRLLLTLDGDDAKRLTVTEPHFQFPPATHVRSIRLGFPKGNKATPLRVQELELRGLAPGRETWSSLQPESHVQGRDLHGGVATDSTPFESTQKLCESYERDANEAGDGDYRDITCRASEPVTFPGTRPESVTELRWLEVTFSTDFKSYRRSFLGFRMQDGWRASVLESKTTDDYGPCPGMSTEGVVLPSLRWQDGLLLAEQTRWYYHGHRAISDPGRTAAVRALRVCQVAPELQCREYVTAFGAPEVDWGSDPDAVPSEPETGPPKKWAWERGFEVRAGAIVRFTACHPGGDATGPVVPCLAPGASRFL